MRIDVIEGMQAFEDLRDNWDAIYAADPEAHVYLSQMWLKAWLNCYRTPWFVLGVRPDEEGADYVAFLVLRMRAMFEKKHGFHNDIIFGGDQFSDYNGLLCRPEFEDEAIPALSRFIKSELNWGEFRLDNWRASDRRRRLLLEPFDRVKFKRQEIPHVEKDTGLNQDICPYIDLPDDWDAYLATLSSNNRQKARRMLRKVEQSDDYRITVADADTYERDLTALLDHWRVKWRPSKGERTESIIQRNRTVLLQVAQQGRLFLPTFWHGDRAIAALATVVDDVKKQFMFVITGRDETFNEIPPGFVLHAFSIRHAIAQGIRTYDFLRGNEPYKYLFGVKDHVIGTTVVSTLSKRNLGGVLDRRTLPSMLAKAKEMTEEREWADAALAFRQIVELEPDDAQSHYRLGRALSKLGDHAGARDALRRSVELEPAGDNAWLLLANALETLGDPSGALDAARKAVEAHPKNEKAANLVWRLSQDAAPAAPTPAISPAQKAPALDMIAAAAQKKSGFNQQAFDPGPRINLDPRVLQGVSPRK